MHLSAYGTVCGTPARLADGPFRPLDNLPPERNVHLKPLYANGNEGNIW